MKKRDPLSTPETMGTSASPRQKPLKGRCPSHGCSGGLVGGVWASFTVSEMDIFIEKPFSVLSLSVCICSADRAKHQAASRARAYWTPKRALGQMISYSVESST
jgi:hypothetical protein